MSALNFAFHLCSLWTMYCEVGIDDASQTNDARQRIMDFWGRVTPGILQLLSHAKGPKSRSLKELADIVNGHLLHMMESLKACNSTILTKLIALWIPVFYAHTGHLNNSTQIRLQQTVNWEPPAPPTQDRSLTDGMLLKWLKGYVLKLGLIESQSSQATQIYIT
ncbi:hypothetical protein BOX15_Mlig008804g1 [Macrostomum lignano]|uniref:Uncharacterized protein n=1 Tax=Macrostomum lignano TaxID=282301 RepID=A0A267EV92_9PLAT|nr:hypothetical protein BOX15_Mlig002962g1 [Macrostomum lignano]PAA86433.1 hypothetical protein BOX15_Mlig008804g1 [Macrostomum lignano]